MGKSSRLICVLACLVATAVLLQAPVAQAGWLPPVDISAAGVHAGTPHVVLDSQGNATAIWDRGTGSETVVESSYRPAGQGWGPAIVLAEEAFSPQVVVDRNSNVTALWEHYESNRTSIQAAERPTGESWGEAATIGQIGLEADPEPQLTVDWEGNAAAVWKKQEVVQAAYRPFAHDWGAPVPISGGESFVPQVTADARGDITAAWMHYDGTHYVVESAYRPEGKEWEAPTLVSAAGEEGGNPHVALDSIGDTLVTWRGTDEGEEAARASFRPVGGDWEAPVTISAKGEEVEGLRDALAPNGDAVAVWSGSARKEGEYRVAHAAFRPAGGNWEDPETISDGTENTYPEDVVFDTAGNAAVVWQSGGVVQAAYRPAGGDWEAAVDLSETGKQGMDPVVVLDAPGDETKADGDATAVWISLEQGGCDEKTPSCGSYTIQAAGYDPLGAPEVEVEVPETGAPGEEIEISAPTDDVWAPRIDFGDGEGADQAAAVHTYDAPGEYDVTFSGAEILGYRSSVTKTITIEPDSSESSDPDPWETTEHGETVPPLPPVAPDTVILNVEPPPSSSNSPSNDAAAVECGSAENLRDEALERLRRARSGPKGAPGSVARHRHAASVRRQRAALRAALSEVESKC